MGPTLERAPTGRWSHHPASPFERLLGRERYSSGMDAISSGTRRLLAAVREGDATLALLGAAIAAYGLIRPREGAPRRAGAKKAGPWGKPKPGSLPNRRAGWRIASLRYCLGRSMNSPTSSGSWRIEAMLGPSRRLVHRRAVRCSQESRLTAEYLHLAPEAGRCVACFQMCWISGHEILGWRLPHARRPSDPRRSRRRRPGPPLPLSSPPWRSATGGLRVSRASPCDRALGVSPRC